MNSRSIRFLSALLITTLSGLQWATAEEQAATPAPGGDPGAQMGGMQHSMGGASEAKPGQDAMGGMQHGTMGMGQPGQAGMGGMQHEGMGSGSQGQGGMTGMQHGGMGGGMSGGMMGGMGGGMMGSMGAMSEQQQEESWKQLQAQDIQLGELRRQMREANDQSVRDKLKAEHRAVLKEQLTLSHKLMMQEHMKSMKGGQPAQPAATP